MKPMPPLEQQCAENLAFALANLMVLEMPSLFGEAPVSVLTITLPFACALVRAEAKAARNRKHARKYRRLCREVNETLRTEDSTVVRPRDLPGFAPFDASDWHVALVPGIGSEHLEVP